jgi:hypothetical protein
MPTHHPFATLAAALALLTASWLPGAANARGFVPQPEPDIEFTEDIDETSLLVVRNGIALSGLLRAALAGSSRTVTVVTDDAVVYEVSFDDDGEYTQVLNHGGNPGAEYEVAAAVNEFDREGGYEAILAGDQDPHVELELDIEGRIGGDVIGIVDVIGGSTGLEMIVVVDPTAIGFDLDWIIQVVLPEIMQGGCSEGGFVGELCDLLGIETDCTCLDMDDPDTGLSTWDILTGDTVDAFDWLWNAWNAANEKKAKKKKDQEEDQEEGEDETGDDDDALTDPDDIAPWSEGPMMMVDEIGALVMSETLVRVAPELDVIQVVM